MKKNIVYRQENHYSCAVACIKSVVAFYNGFVPEKIINDDLHLTKNGTNALFVINALRKYGFNADGFKVSDIKKISVPFIAHLNKDDFNHFVVVYKTNKKIKIMDPSVGFRKLSYEEFYNLFSGVVINLSPAKKIIKYKNKNILTNIAKKGVQNNKKRIITTTIINLIILFLSYLIASFPKISSLYKTIIIFKIFITSLIIKFILVIINNNLKLKITTKFKEKSNVFLLKNIFKRNLKEFNNHTVGELVNKIINFKQIENIVVSIIFNLSIQIIIMIITNIILLKTNTYLFIFFLIYEVIYSFIVILFYKKYNYNFEVFKNKESDYLSLLNEYLNSILTIKSLNLNYIILDDLKIKYRTLLQDFTNYMKKYMFFENCKNHLFELFILFENLFGIYLVSISSFSYTSLISLNLIFTLTNNSLNQILDITIELLKSKYYINSLNDFFNQEDDVRLFEVNSFKKILIKDYSYSHDYITCNLYIKNFIITAGDKVLITGKNGTGKSTFAKSLSGLYMDFKGKILIDGVDIKSIKNVQNLVLYTSKNDVIFNKTIKENITLSNNNEVLDEIIKICKLENILKNKNLDTRIGDKYQNLSDGEKAQIVLARCLTLKPKVLIIDELLSNLNERLEDEILRSLFNKKELTLVYITHRNKNFPFNKILKL